MHEVERPDLVEPVRRHKGSTHARRTATSGPPRQVQAEGVIHAVDPFVIPPVAVKAQPVISSASSAYIRFSFTFSASSSFSRLSSAMLVPAYFDR